MKRIAVIVLLVSVTAYAQVPSPNDVAMIDLTNVARAKKGIGPLLWNDHLWDAAEEHVLDLAAHKGNCPSLHDSCNGEYWAHRVERFYPDPYYIGENAALGISDPQALVDGWLASPTHYANMMNPIFTEGGCAEAEGDTPANGKMWWATCDFGTQQIESTPHPTPKPTRTPRPTRTPKPKRTPKNTPRPHPTRTPRP